MPAHRLSERERGVVPKPELTIKLPAEGAGVFGEIEVRVLADPERATHVVRIQRREGTSGPWTTVRTDDSSPIYIYYDDLADVPVGTTIQYRAILKEPDGTRVVSAVRTVNRVAPVPLVPSVTVAGTAVRDRLPDGLGSDVRLQRPDVRHLRRPVEGHLDDSGGDYAWKVAINNSWDVNYGAGGAAGGSDIPLVVPAGGASVTFVWDQITKIPTATIG